MALQPAGTLMRDRWKKPMLMHEDSSIKKAMKSVMKLGRANNPKMPKPMKETTGVL